jgi:hypothetical protein
MIRKIKGRRRIKKSKEGVSMYNMDKLENRIRSIRRDGGNWFLLCCEFGVLGVSSLFCWSDWRDGSNWFLLCCEFGVLGVSGLFCWSDGSARCSACSALIFAFSMTAVRCW